ncbi:Shikimate dehydrogenase (NADP(+)) [Trichinella spiralis]|uniref:Shikimate dehydrogenase (NADP(+)) n=1 Tax=Trichinella spiralis TaxID=6334 RepID=A0ABR3KEB6_TRISP
MHVAYFNNPEEHACYCFFKTVLQDLLQLQLEQTWRVNSYCEKGRVLNFTMKLVTAAKTSKAVYRAADVSDGGLSTANGKIYKVDCSRMVARNASLEAGVKKVDIE